MPPNSNKFETFFENWYRVTSVTHSQKKLPTDSRPLIKTESGHWVLKKDGYYWVATKKTS